MYKFGNDFLDKVVSFFCQCPLGREHNTEATLSTKERQVSDCALAHKPSGLWESYCRFASSAEVLRTNHTLAKKCIGVWYAFFLFSKVLDPGLLPVESGSPVKGVGL